MASTKTLVVKYHQDFGRLGSLSGMFLATESEVRAMKAAGSAYLGECLGKHSDITAELSDATLTVTANAELVAQLRRSGLCKGHYIVGVDVLGVLVDQVSWDEKMSAKAQAALSKRDLDTLAADGWSFV